mgnify:CR=1 FL=1
MSRCLVTGHRGYIGSRLYKKLVDLGHEVQGIDLVEGNDINSLQGLVEDKHGKFHPRWANFKPEYVFHLACIPRVAYSIEEPVKTMQNNVLAGSNVLNFARKIGAKRVIYSSSSSINGNGDGPTTKRYHTRSQLPAPKKLSHERHAQTSGRHVLPTQS